MLEKLDIPFSQGVSISGWSLFRDFFKIKLPYVIKLESKFMHGRQTLIVTEENLEDVFYKLFGKYSNKEITQYAIEFSDTAIIENYIDIDYEISYHAIMNKTSWKYLGSARDYKHQYENDLGELSDSMGAYYVKDVISQIHDYAEKIYKHLCSINRPYQGIMFLGIAVSKDGIPYVLEINTRPGDPEIVPIALGVKNFLDVITETARNNEIPDIIHSNVESVSVSVNNTDLNWNNTATDLPNIGNLPKDILFGLDGSFTTRSKHSLLSTTGPTRENAANKIFNFLKTQDLGQFYFRKDIGILK
jgi:phosphoribosylamine-glycine ligase